MPGGPAAAALLGAQQRVLAAAAARRGRREVIGERLGLGVGPALRGVHGQDNAVAFEHLAVIRLGRPHRLVHVIADLEGRVEIGIVPHEVADRTQVDRRPGVIVGLGGDLVGADERDRAAGDPVVQSAVDLGRTGRAMGLGRVVGSLEERDAHIVEQRPAAALGQGREAHALGVRRQLLAAGEHLPGGVVVAAPHDLRVEEADLAPAGQVQRHVRAAAHVLVADPGRVEIGLSAAHGDGAAGVGPRGGVLELQHVPAQAVAQALGAGPERGLSVHAPALGAFALGIGRLEVAVGEEIAEHVGCEDRQHDGLLDARQARRLGHQHHADGEVPARHALWDADGDLANLRLIFRQRERGGLHSRPALRQSQLDSARKRACERVADAHGQSPLRGLEEAHARGDAAGLGHAGRRAGPDPRHLHVVRHVRLERVEVGAFEETGDRAQL